MIEKLKKPRSVELRARCLTDDPLNNSRLLGCHGCPEAAECGGLHLEEQMFDCLSMCCGNKSKCTQTCPNAPERFVAQRREVGNFTLDNVPRTPVLKIAPAIDIAELIYHGGKRFRPLDAGAVALRLADLINFTNGLPKFSTRDQLLEAFRISRSSRLIVSGVDHDHRIEAWWKLGDHRLVILAALQSFGIELVTTPNFSVVIDVPRADNLHAMKRIALNFAEFQQHGIPCALHPNGRTEHDFARWAEFIALRPEVEVLAYEFITGPGLKSRKKFHLDMLAFLVQSAGRPLDIVVRGDPHVLPFLRQHYRNITYIDTTAFVKTMRRRRAERVANRMIDWPAARTHRNELLDERLQHNLDEQTAYLRSSYFHEEQHQFMAA